MPGTGRRCPPRAAHQRARAPTPSRRPRTRGRFKSYRGSKRRASPPGAPSSAPSAPAFLPARPNSLEPSARLPLTLLAGRERGDLLEPPEPARTPALPPVLSSNTRAKLSDFRGKGGLGEAPLSCRPPFYLPPQDWWKTRGPERPPRRAGAGLLSSKV